MIDAAVQLVDRPILSEPAFIAREQELEELEQCLEETSRGKQTLVFLQGLSGRGKSRLLHEFVQRTGENVLSIEGRGTQGVQRPFQLLVGAVQELIAAAQKDAALKETFLRITASSRSSLCAVLPELRQLYGDEEEKETGREDFGEDRTLRALVLLLDSLGLLSRPTLLILDDCQWADEMVFKLLSRWQRMRGDQQRKLMIVVTFRTDEIAADHPLSKLKPDLRLALGEFGEHALREMLQSMAGQVPEDAVQLVSRLSGGSPFMANVVLHGLAELGVMKHDGAGWSFSADAVTEEMTGSGQGAEFLRRRLELLQPATIEILKAGAVLGKEFSARLAAAIAGYEEGLLEEGERRHIVRRQSESGSYIFVHDKLRETLLAMLTPESHRLLCRRIALLLEAEEGERIFDLAYYFHAAGEHKLALPYALKAAAEARSRASLQLAEQQYQIAFLGVSRGDKRTLYRITFGLGEVLMLRGMYQEALQQFDAARENAETELEAAHIEARTCETIFKLGDTRRALKAAEDALSQLGVRVPKSELGAKLAVTRAIGIQALHSLLPWAFLHQRPLPGGEKQMIICRLFNQLSYSYYYEGKISLARALWAHLAALNLAELYPPTRELAHLYAAHGPAMSVCGWFSRADEYGNRSLQVAAEIRSVWSRGQALNFRGISFLPSGQYAECIEACGEAARLLERAGDQWEFNMAKCNVAYGLYRAGNLPQAAQLAERSYFEALEIHDTTSASSCLSLWSKASGGNIPINEAERLRTMFPETACHPIVEVGQAAALYWAAQGDLKQATEILEESWGRVKQRFLQEYIIAVLPWLVTMRRLRIERSENGAARNRDLRRAVWLAQQARLSIPFFGNNGPQIYRELALLSLLDSKPIKAGRYLDLSIQAAQKRHARYEYAQSLYALHRIERSLGLAQSEATREKALQLLTKLNAAEVFFRLEHESERLRSAA